MQSSNTFGTFLQTFNQLDQSSRDPAEAALYRIVGEIAGHGGQSLVADVLSHQSDRNDFMSALELGRQRGLLRLDAEADQPTVALTPLGQVYTSAAD